MKPVIAMQQRIPKGMTLIELMIVVAIIGILAAIAYPAYLESILKGRRAEGRTAIIDLMQQQERYMTQHGTYSLMSGASAGLFKSFSGDSAATGYYTLATNTCVAPAPSDLRLCVQILATPRIAGSDPKVEILMMDSSGVKTCTGQNKELCWK